MKFWEVLQGLKEGKKFARKAWEGSDIYVALSATRRVVLQNNSYHTLWIEDYEATDWFEVK